ncbi:MAG: DNA polymerase I [Candidatus Cloacimonetes bacterium 4572_55]|nr:MAG: DNA polymerase I [Candidatus Cloacimonetes bacterium 4572_55]
MSELLRENLFLVDGHALAYRMFFAFRDQNLSTDGKPTSAIYGFITTILRLLDAYKPSHFAVVFDPSGSTHRHEMYDAYKATREKMPSDLAEQLPRIHEFLSAMDCPVIEEPGFEADDIIGAIAEKFGSQGTNVVIYSADKDFMQLVTDRVRMLKPGRRGADDKWITAIEVQKKFGVQPNQVIDALAMIGDVSDNVPGIDGVGEKTAAKLLAKHGSLDRILENTAQLSHKRARTFFSNPINIDLIRLSKKLVTIRRDAPLFVNLEDLKRHSFDHKKMFELCKRLKFRSLLKRFLPKNEQLGLDLSGSASAIKADYRQVNTWEKFERLLEVLASSSGFAFDMETTDKNSMRARSVGISFAVKPGEAWYIPIAHVKKGGYEQGDRAILRNFQEGNLSADRVWSELKPIFENPNIPKYAHNMKYDMMVLAQDAGIEVQGKLSDSMIAAWLIDPIRHHYGLKELSLELFGHRMTTYTDMVGKGKDQINFSETDIAAATAYGCQDSDFTLRLQEIFAPKLKSMKLDSLFHKIETPLLPVLMDMERAGMMIDRAVFTEMSARLETGLIRRKQIIYELADEEFNINSTKQLREILYEKLKLPVLKRTPRRDPSTDAKTLEKLARDHDLPAQIIEYRELNKLKNTYVDALPKLINPITGRIHTSFNQTVIPTGRLSTREPNLQNIPIRSKEGREIRKGFVPGERYDLLLSADYSQIELRILAHYAGDGALSRAFQQGEDVHRLTAATVFGCPIEEVTSEMRRVAKVTNFGIIYGQTPFGLSNSLGMSVKEAQHFINAYFATYPGVKNYIESAVAQAKDKGYTTTLKGRRRPLPDVNSTNRHTREYAERIAVNTPIQGTAADMIKIAMIHIHRQLKEEKFRSRMILQVHDELIFEVVEEEADRLKNLVVKTMENALPLDVSVNVPVKVQVGIGKSWFEAHS